MTAAQRKPLKQKAQVRTNATPGSVCRIDAPAVKFADLWGNYVTGDPYADPTGAYKNQCAIRMSATLHRVGIEMKSFSEKVIKPPPGKDTIGRILLKGKATATRADEMAIWLNLQPFCGLPKRPQDVTGTDWEMKVKGRTGIIFFGEYWARDGESSDRASGGHIDLWNQDTLTPSSTSFFRFRLGFNSLWYSDLRNSKKILFWEIK
ncbi:hypothetical protein LMG7141_02559 [Ralstonia condita]|uniref:Type VI secretion system (T6SS) effector Tae4 (Amidase) n=1 Tax=Ralstonia condita TaxID=3058600 RepID=A0ABM9JEW2_9RALS|nr:type VI secretion system amidase effector protein Tae4 [Ralstonia sp. LMG 7141]CAJ0791770.1 hypothetical protein LMG7141_02559 [Ralstonia sp. LMG 7141]